MAERSDFGLGSIWLVVFDPSIGTEIRKTRPAVIMSGTAFNLKRTKVTLLPFTSARPIDSRLSPAVVEVFASQQNGLSGDSLLVCIEPMTFDKVRFIHKLGQLEADLLQNAQAILQRYLSLGSTRNATSV